MTEKREPETKGNKSQGCGGKSSGFCGGVSRRDFLRMAGAASAAFMAGDICFAGASSFLKSPHLVPADKALPAGWVRSLFERGVPLAWKGDELKTIGMPVGGIGTGQLYLCGDGTLGLWEIFNRHNPPPSHLGYPRRNIPKTVENGFALRLRVNGTDQIRMLNETGFSEVSFRGEHPIGTVTYCEPSVGLTAKLEAFSPFIPLNAPDSGLPATFMVVSVENKGQSEVDVSLLSWLENPIAKSAGEEFWKGTRTMKIVREQNATRIIFSARSAESGKPVSERPVVRFADFEGDTFGEWSATGEAFTQPASDKIDNQQPVSGFAGKRFVNSFIKGDSTTGTLVSPEFTVSRKYVNFLIGGGRERVGMRLLVEGKEVRTASGRDSEHLTRRSWDVSQFMEKKARLEIFDHSTTAWGHVLVDEIEFSDLPRREEEYDSFQAFPDFGTMTWCCSHQTQKGEDAGRNAALLKDRVPVEVDWSDAQECDLTKRRCAGIATAPQTLKPGASAEYVFLLTWHFPNTTRPDRECGHEYAARFDDADAVAKYALENRERLIGDTRKWRDTWYDSTLPYWLLDRLHLTASCLATGTSMWWKNGRFWAWEGVVCCEGTCTHVWNYAQTLARLFPSLERSVREMQDFGVALLPDGLVGFRHNGAYAADGQCGTILKAWREHLMSPDDSFLRRNWASIKKAMDYAIRQDGNEDGLIENSQHNTYDINFFGPNTFVGALYLAALRACEQMALEMGEKDYAERMRRICESGRRATEETLWNGEYFIQKVDLSQHPQHQYGPGCLSDQLFGQNWAHQTSLGYLYAEDKVKKALESVWRYNWAPDTGVYNQKYPAGRHYSDPAEAGLFICTWPHSEHLDEGVLYRDEVWTGIEYQVASHMIYEGMVEEALAICRAVHDRYHPAKRNPFNEVECSDFYARAMASWGVLLALSGYEYHGPKGVLTFAPRITPEHFRCAFTCAEGWGSFEQKVADGNSKWSVDVKQGKLRLKELRLGVPADAKAPREVTVAGKVVQATVGKAGNLATITFEQPAVIEQGQAVVVTS